MRGQAVDLGPVKQRTVLAVLLVEAGRPVTIESLADRLWERTPPSARSVLYAHASRLRRLVAAMADTTGVPIALSRRSGGYVLDVERRHVDVHEFHRLVRESQHSQNDDEHRADLLRHALDLWRGGPLSDLFGGWVTAVGQVWEQQRLAAAVDWARTMAGLGRSADVVADLTDLATSYPWVEPLVCELMRALQAAGRGPEALDWYARTRTRLAEELGLEPGRELRELHHAILRGTADRPTRPERAVVPPYRNPPPAQLPTSVAEFVGRAGELAGLEESRRAGASCVVVSGTAGVGKTELAVHWALGARRHFPDGQLYVNLRGWASRAPLRPVVVLGQFLRALGVPALEVPIELGEAAALYRSLLADRRVLVLLDNARTADQVRPLLPAAPGCLALVTSRHRLGGLVADGARRIDLDVLTPPAAAELLGSLLDSSRTAGAAAAVDRLAAACGRLPLALRIAAAVLADRPGQRLTDYVAELSAGDRLAVLAVDGDTDRTVRAALALSYRALPPATRRLFCLVGAAPGGDFTAGSAAASAGVPVQRAARLVDQLVGAHMVHEQAPGRYAFHDLLRLYARREAPAEVAGTELRAAFRRLCGYYLSGVDAAARLLYPHASRLPLPAVFGSARVPLDDHRAALSWLDAERANLVAVTEVAADEGPRELAWLLADALRGYFGLRQDVLDWLVVARAGLAAASAENDPLGQASAHQSLAEACHSLSRFPQAAEHLADALSLSRDGGWWQGQTAALYDLGLIHADTGRLREAVEHHSRALAASRVIGSAAGAAVTLDRLGDVYHQRGQLYEAADRLTAALSLYEEINSPSGHANALTRLGGIYADLRQQELALDHLRRGLALHREVGDRQGEATALAALSRVQHAAGRLGEAIDSARTAVAISERLGDKRLRAMADTALAAAESALGRRSDAAALYRRARAAASAAGTPYPEAVALIGLARLHRSEDEVDEAVAHATDALRTARAAGYGGLEREALHLLAAGA